MKRTFSGRMLGTVLSCGVLFVCGCATVVDQLPPPPPVAFPRIELNGPYDREIPEKLVEQLRDASVTMDWAIPYLFMTVAMHFESVGDVVKAVHFYDRAIEGFQTRNELAGEGTATSRKISALYEFGSHREAFNIISDREKIWNSPFRKAFVDYNYGHYYFKNGEYARARDYFRQAFTGNANFRDDVNRLMLRRDTELEYGIVVILADSVRLLSQNYRPFEIDQGMFTVSREHMDEGIGHLHQALALNREIRRTEVGRFTPENVFQVREADAYNYLGLAEGIRGDGAGARHLLAVALDLARRAGYRIGEVEGIFFLNQVWLSEKNITEGRKAAELLNVVADKYRFSFYQVWAKFILSRYSTGLGDNARAVGLLREALAIIEQSWTNGARDILKETYPFNRQVVYESLMALLAREGDFPGALEIAERLKAQTLVDLLAGKDISRNAAEAALLQEEGKISGDIAMIRTQLGRAGVQQNAEALLARLEKQEEAQQGVRLKIKKENAELASLVSVQPPSPAEIQVLLDENTTLFDYYVTDNLLYVWAITRERVHLERVGITQEELRNLVGSFMGAIKDRDRRTTSRLSQQIYDVIIKPIIPYVSGDRIGFVPHDSLYYLPFAALSYKGRYLVDGFSLFYLPGTGVMKYVMEKKIPSHLKILVVGNPDLGDPARDLPDAALEMEMIQKRISSTTVLAGKDATRTRLKEMLADCDVLHFAAHGQLVPESPLDSSLLLAPGGGRDDGKLTALKIFKLRFPGRAVVMSKCQTVLGMSSRGSEIVSLTRSFLYAGSPSVISTLWNVADKAMGPFVNNFYRGLAQGKEITDSLQSAQRNMIRSGYAPYFWAPFILTGRH